MDKWQEGVAINKVHVKSLEGSIGNVPQETPPESEISVNTKKIRFIVWGILMVLNVKLQCTELLRM